MPGSLRTILAFRSMREQKIETVQPGPTHSLDSAVANLPSCSPRRGAVRVMTPMHSGCQWPGHGASLRLSPTATEWHGPEGHVTGSMAPPDASRGPPQRRPQ